jgi:adenosylmethionine-8-amino-7-oxononanoate aminotransferase
MNSDLSVTEMLSFDREHIWHPYTSMTNPLPCFLVDSAEGVYLHLKSGQRLIDGMSSWWAMIHGYNNSHINEAICNQLKKMSHVMFGGLTHEPAIRLAKRLIDMVPTGLEHVFFCDSGSVAVEVAMKVALQYWHAQKRGKKCKFATISSGYHGDTWHAMSVCDPVTGMHQIFNSGLSAQLFVDAPTSKFDGDWNDADLQEVQALFSDKHNEIAAFIIEPIVQGAGGMRFYHPFFLKELKRLCQQYDILLIVDEIATGFGRTGKLFASEWSDISPDIMCVGKAITGGYLSFAATLTSKKIATVISEGHPGVLMHGPTFMGNPLACAAANASLDLIESTDILEKVKTIERALKKGLAEARLMPQVADVRVLGAIGVVETKDTVDLERIQNIFVANNIWVRPFGKLIYIMPPFIISPDELNQLIAGLLASIKTYYHG